MSWQQFPFKVRYSTFWCEKTPPYLARYPHSKLASEADVARRMLRSMPARAVEIIREGDFGGADLVQVTSDAYRPSFKESGGSNFVFLQARNTRLSS